MAFGKSSRARKSKSIKSKASQDWREQRPIFELTPLEKRILLSSAAYATYDFESGSTTGWSGGTVATSNAISNWGSTEYLQAPSSGPLTLTLTGIPAHTGTGTISFDIYALDEWDGNNSPSEFTFSVNSKTKIDTTFSNPFSLWDDTSHTIDHFDFNQSFPSSDYTSFPENNPTQYRAVTTGDMDSDNLNVCDVTVTNEFIDPDNGADTCGACDPDGYWCTIYDPGYGNISDAVYAFTVPINDSSSSLTLSFGYSLPSNAKLGIDNVAVTFDDLAPPPSGQTPGGVDSGNSGTGGGLTPNDNGNGADLFSGNASFEIPGPHSKGFGSAFSGKSIWTNGSLSGIVGGLNGNGTMQEDIPSLLQNGPSTLILAQGANQSWFNNNGSSWAEQYGGLDSLTYDSANSQYVVVTPDGGRTAFYDFNQGGLSGDVKSLTDPNGNTTTFSYTGSQLTAATRSSTINSTTTTETFTYGYLTSPDPNAGKLSSISLSRQINSGSPSVVQKVVYSYYTSSSTGGSLGDLESATIEDGSSNTLNEDFYRYYISGDSDTHGYVGGIKYILAPASYARLAAALPSGTTPATATDAQMAPYADEYFQYDSKHRVTEQVIQGAGSSLSSGTGLGTYSMTYATPSSNLANYNEYIGETTETLPNGTQQIDFFNGFGEDMLSLLTDGTHYWANYTQYDEEGRPILSAGPSAVTIGSFSGLTSYADLIDNSSSDKLNSSGLITTTSYYSDTTATSRIAGDASGYVSDVYIQNGESGSAIHQEHRTYYSFSNTGSTATIFPLATDTVYGNADGSDPRTTSYLYTMSSGTVEPQVVTIGLAPVTSGQNGNDTSSTATSSGSTTTLVDTGLSSSGSFVGDVLTILTGTDGGEIATVTAYNGSTHTLTISPAFLSSTDSSSVYTLSGNVNTTFYDNYGRVVWTKNADGYVDYFAYDQGTGAVVKTIADVVYADLSASEQANFPTGWTHPSGGLNLVTTDVVDGLGRTTEETSPDGNETYTVYNDPSHEMRIYPGFNGTTTTGPISVYQTYYPSANSGNLLYDETLTTSATPHLTGGVPDGTETISGSNIQSLQREFTNSAGQFIWSDRYFSFSGLTYSQAVSLSSGVPADLGTSGTNFYRTVFGYGIDGQENRQVTPTGTIYRTVFDALGRVSSEWVGTGDTHSGTEWTPSSNTGNMMDIVDLQYDGGGVGDGNVTQTTDHPGLSEADRVTQFLYDWRDRKVLEKDGVQSTEDTTTYRPITYYHYNNLDEVTETDLYDGDGVSLSGWGSTSGVPNAPSSSLLRAKTVYSYDDEGRVYREQVYSIDQSSGTVGSDLTTDTFYDHRGNVIATFAAGGLVTKYAYDGAGRLSNEYTTDGGAVNDSNSPQKDWAHASCVSSDVVLTETDYTYDSDGNVIVTTTRDRFDNDSTSSEGALGSPSSGIGARISYVADYYDAADRLTDEVNVGTNGGSGYTRPSSVPSRSDTVLVTHTDYDSAGNVLDTIDPRDLMTQYTYDLLGRVTQEIDDSSGGSPATGLNVTNYTYDGDNNLLTVQAYEPNGTTSPSQTTQYEYGVGGTSGTNLFSNDLLYRVDYPNPSTGAAGTTAAQQVTYSYNLAGDTIGKTDQNGTTHSYSYDVLDRLVNDSISSFGSGVDVVVKGLGYSYNALGMPYQVTSLGFANGVINQLQYNYNGYGQLTNEYQSVSGAVNTTTTPDVVYSYSQPSGANYSRLSSMTYPNGRVLDYAYNSGLDSDISRVSAIADDGGSASGNLQSYTYLGLDTIVQQADANGIALSYIHQTGDTLSSSDGGDRYTGLDRFGRVIDQDYVNTSTGVSTDRFQYGYDRDSNTLYENNLVTSNMSELFHSNSSSSGDNATAYDGLNRITAYARGTLSASGHNGSTLDTVSSPSTTETWTLDALGNITADTGASRSSNSQNELTSDGSYSPTYDNNGNMITDGLGTTYIYDAWNRPVAVKSGTSTIYTYGYMPDGNIDTGHDSCAGITTDIYYSSDGHEIEDRTSSGTVTTQYVWGLGAANNLVLRDDNSTSGSLGKTSSGLGRRIFAQHDVNFNITALTDTSGAVLQRFYYTPYGTFTTNSYNWNYQFQSGQNEPYIGIKFGARDYNPTMEVWMEPDPIDYVNGLDRYQMESSNPIKFNDPLGLDATGTQPNTCQPSQPTDPNDDGKVGPPPADATDRMKQNWKKWVKAPIGPGGSDMTCGQLDTVVLLLQRQVNSLQATVNATARFVRAANPFVKYFEQMMAEETDRLQEAVESAELSQAFYDFAGNPFVRLGPSLATSAFLATLTTKGSWPAGSWIALLQSKIPNSLAAVANRISVYLLAAELGAYAIGGALQFEHWLANKDYAAIHAYVGDPKNLAMYVQIKSLLNRANRAKAQLDDLKNQLKRWQDDCSLCGCC